MSLTTPHRIATLAAAILLLNTHSLTANDRIATIQSIPNLVAFWGFDQQPGQRTSIGAETLTLQEVGAAAISRVAEGPITGYSADLPGSSYLKLSRATTGALNIHGADAQVTVVAWAKLDTMNGPFLAGFWDEGRQRRQYGLFVDLPGYGGNDQVCGHVSATGGPTPGYPWSKDYSASLSTVPVGQWATIGFTYDGTYARSYYNGQFELRPGGGPDGEDKNPYYYPDGLYDGLGAAGGSDFTVGAVNMSGTGVDNMGHLMNGRLGGVAVYDRKLSDSEMESLVFNTQYIPEPGTVVLLGLGLSALATIRRRKV